MNFAIVVLAFLTSHCKQLVCRLTYWKLWKLAGDWIGGQMEAAGDLLTSFRPIDASMWNGSIITQLGRISWRVLFPGTPRLITRLAFGAKLAIANQFRQQLCINQRSEPRQLFQMGLFLGHKWRKTRVGSTYSNAMDGGAGIMLFFQFICKKWNKEAILQIYKGLREKLYPHPERQFWISPRWQKPNGKCQEKNSLELYTK